MGLPFSGFVVDENPGLAWVPDVAGMLHVLGQSSSDTESAVPCLGMCIGGMTTRWNTVALVKTLENDPSGKECHTSIGNLI